MIYPAVHYKMCIYVVSAMLFKYRYYVPARFFKTYISKVSYMNT